VCDKCFISLHHLEYVMGVEYVIVGVMTFVLCLIMCVFCINRCVFAWFWCGVTSNLFMMGEI
jgi:hypothetical protein